MPEIKARQTHIGRMPSESSRKLVDHIPRTNANGIDVGLIVRVLVVPGPKRAQQVRPSINNNLTPVLPRWQVFLSI